MSVRDEAIALINEMPESSVVYIVQIIKGIRGLGRPTDDRKREAFKVLQGMQMNDPTFDEEEALAEYWEGKA